MMKLIKAAFVGLALMVLPTAAAQSATLSLVGGTSNVTLPANFSGNPQLALTGLQAGVDQVTVFNSSNAANEGLALSGPATIRFDYLGTEAGYTNKAIELEGFGVLFNNKTSTPGQSVTVTLSPNANGLLPFKFSTSGGGNPADAENGNITNPLAIAFTDIVNNSVIALFGDGAGDQDYDDMAIRISVVPLPPALVLFGAALFGLGWLGKRKKAA
ncbi:hypothetical protein GUA87_06010 [Sneathiella sp. P13V-1]|uniref:hypothetical protein n=1 Tax=Sneathiella sp. P13V-1 TaxID=2697366 RepID=UPI00187B80A6|nr:hypothetical protein [Sneathiella sp. P13V-1]MBE7636392.1 hypothetical protein [Sneathiella sp. P13V-1]